MAPGRLVGDITARVIDAGRRIADSPTDDPRLTVQRALLDRGAAGWAFLHDATGNLDERDACLAFAGEAVGAHETHLSLHRGFVGVYWAHQRLLEADADLESFLAEVDDAILAAATQPPPRYGHDLINGLVGLGIYALDRLPRPSARALLEEVVRRLLERAQWSGPHARWHTPQGGPNAAEEPSGIYDTGMGRGMSGIVCLLSAAVSRGIATGAAEAIRGCAAYLLAQRTKHWAGSIPIWITGDGRAEEPAQGWVYGDTGIAWALWLAGRCLRDASLEAAAIELARGGAERDPHGGKIWNPNFCRGAAGVAHILRRLGQATGDAPLRAGAVKWLEAARAMHDAHRAQSPRWPAEVGDPKEDGTEVDLRLVFGEPGLALAILAAEAEAPPKWERLFLVDAPA